MMETRLWTRRRKDGDDNRMENKKKEKFIFNLSTPCQIHSVNECNMEKFIDISKRNKAVTAHYLYCSLFCNRVLFICRFLSNLLGLCAALYLSPYG